MHTESWKTANHLQIYEYLFSCLMFARAFACSRPNKCLFKMLPTTFSHCSTSCKPISSSEWFRSIYFIYLVVQWLVYAYAGTSAVSIYLSIEQLMENSLHKLNANSFLVRAFFLISNTIHLLFDSEKLDSVNSLEIVTFSSECHVICSTHIVTSFSIAWFNISTHFFFCTVGSSVEKEGNLCNVCLKLRYWNVHRTEMTQQIYSKITDIKPIKQWGTRFIHTWFTLFGIWKICP